jgi:hypothetical protein
VVDSADLLDQGDRIRAALDVADPEPRPDGHPRFSGPGVLISPHVGGVGGSKVEVPARRLVAEQLGRFAQGEPLLNVVGNPTRTSVSPTAATLSAAARSRQDSNEKDGISMNSMSGQSIDYRRQVPVVDAHDVVVVGGGPAGIAAAISAGRAGANTLLIEQHGYLGGNLTAGLVGPCMTSFSLDGSIQLIRGVFDEMIRRMEEAGTAIHPSTVPAGSPYSGFIEYGHARVTPFEPEGVKSVALQMCREAGVDILFHAFVIDALVDDQTVRAVVGASKSGMHVHPAAVVIDCSADGDVAVQAGAGAEVGRDSDGLTQPMTLFFRVEGVDDAVVEQYVRDHPDDYRPFASIVAEGHRQGRFPAPRRGIGLYKTLRRGVWRINTTRILKYDGADVHGLTAAEIEGRRQVEGLVTFFQESLPGFANCSLLDTAATVGVRETRRIVGDYTLTLEDLQSGGDFDDVIALAGYPVDIHDPTGSGGGVGDGFTTANVYRIPYRSLLPRGVENLLVAGRCVSATHEALGAIRVMPPAFAMGEAAGAAAALAVRAGVTPRQVDVHELQKQLVAQGAYLGQDLP